MAPSMRPTTARTNSADILGSASVNRGGVGTLSRSEGEIDFDTTARVGTVIGRGFVAVLQGRLRLSFHIISLLDQLETAHAYGRRH
jgi:hypothetical protein